MSTKRFERIALAQLLVAGCAVVFGLEHAQAQPGYVPPATPLPPPVFNPSSPNIVPQPSYKLPTCKKTESNLQHQVPFQVVRLCRGRMKSPR